jgi:histidine kinase/DNA gyrase B/HSP90-like ATPase
MKAETQLKSISIRPGVAILSVLRHLNYRPWYAMAEFVDNSLQSFVQNRQALQKIEGPKFKLKVEIELEEANGGRIIIRDNAAGIKESEYQRAFRPAELPPDTSGLAEFGMGMKSAACWFADKWSVRTSALGEGHERLVSFDISKIVEDKLEELAVVTKPAQENAHFTEIVLNALHKVPQGRTLSKIKDHLASIYRIWLRRHSILLVFDGEELSYSDPKILSAPHYKRPSDPPVKWEKVINFDLGLGLSAHGFAALRETGSTSEAGFSLFRRDRLIQGGADEGYRPESIFRKSNSFTYQRLFGELHLDGFEVSHTKDGFRWDENEETFLDLLKQELNKEPLPLLDQAEEYRVKRKPGDFQAGADAATQRTADVIEREVPPVLKEQLDSGPESAPPPERLPHAGAIASQRIISLELNGQAWQVTLELSTDPGIGDWITVSDNVPPAGDRRIRCLGLRMALSHPFMDRFGGTEPERIEPLLRVAVAVALGEVVARESGDRMAGTVRRTMNELLRDALAKP